MGGTPLGKTSCIAFVVILTLSMVVPTAALGASTASSSEFVVETQDRIDDDGNIGSAEDTDGDNVYATIQTAVDEAPAGATIDVTQGTYNESVLIDKSDITLVGVPGNTGAGAGNSAPVMDSGGTLAGAFELTHKADNVAIRGFNIANYTNLGVFPTTGRTRAIESVVVADNTFSGIKYSIGFLSREDGAILTDITANNNRISGGTIGINIFARTGVSEIENTHITNNVITGTRLDGIQLTAFSDNATIQDVTIQDNYIDSGLKGIDITSRQSDTTIQRISVENNDLTNSGEGVFLSAPEGGTLNTIDVGHNNVTDNTNGTVVDAETTGQVSVNYNSFEGNSNYAVSNRGDDILDARNNWWGDATGPTVASNPGGTGGAVSENVSYEPATTRVVDVKNASAPVAGHAEVDIAADAGNVAGYELTVEFNESVLEVVDVQGADLGEPSENIDNGNGVVTFTRGESQGVDDPTLATIEFNVTAAGQSNVTVDDAESAIYDADGDAISSITSEQGVVEDSVAGDGDVNGDDSVNAGDVILLQRYIVGDDVSIDEQAADVDGDGDIDASDALQIQQDIVSG